MTCEEHIALAQFTTFKIGGPARYFCRVSSDDALVAAVRLAHGKGLPLFVLGGGSNILVSDAGFPGVVIRMEQRGIWSTTATVKSSFPRRQGSCGMIWWVAQSKVVYLGSRTCQPSPAQWERLLSKTSGLMAVSFRR